MAAERGGARSLAGRTLVAAVAPVMPVTLVVLASCQWMLHSEEGDARQVAATSDSAAPDATDATETSACGAANLSTDREHCGLCNHDCLGGDCAEGACQPRLLAESLDSPWYLAGDADYLYVSSNRVDQATSHVMRVPKVSGEPAPLALNEQPQFGIGFYRDHVIWTYLNNQGWRGTSRDGGGGVTFPSDMPPHKLTELVAVREDALWVTSFSAGLVYRWSPSVGSSLSYLVPAAEGIVADEQYVYIASNDDGAPGLYRAPLDGEPIPVLKPASRPRRLAIDASYVYWTTLYNQVGRVSKVSLRPEYHSVAAENGVGGIAADGTHVYFVNEKSGAIFASETSGRDMTEPKVIASGYERPVDIHVDAKAIYWTDHQKGQIWKLAK